MKIQPIDFNTTEELGRYEPVKPLIKSRFKRLFERPFTSFLRIPVPDKLPGIEESNCNKDGGPEEFEPSSVCLAKMVRNFIEQNNDKQSAMVRCGQNRCNCFNGIINDSSEDELESFYCFGDSNHPSSVDACEILKGLVPCASLSERNLLADTAKIVEKNKIGKRKDDFCRKIVTDGLLAHGYDASICKSHWEKSPSYPAGEYEYVDVIIEGERLIVDIDFRSEFEIARSTKTYKAILQTLPQIFVGKADRLQMMICLVSEAAKQSLKKKGMPVPPWRKAEYVKAKWFSPYTRTTPTPLESNGDYASDETTNLKSEKKEPLMQNKSSCGEFELIFGEKITISPLVETDHGDGVFGMSESDSSGEEERTIAVKHREIKAESSQIGVKIVTGFASVI